jgi:hypothetical protein
MTAPTRTTRPRSWPALSLGLTLVGALALSPALAQAAAPSTPGAAATTSETIDGHARRGAWTLRRGPEGALLARGPMGGTWFGRPGGPMADGARRRFEARSGASDERSGGGAFARWLAADGAAGPLVPGLVGRAEDGTTVRIAFYDGAPEDGGTELAALTFEAGVDDVGAFRERVRAAADGATHVAIDVLGRVVALPEATPADTAE